MVLRPTNLPTYLLAYLSTYLPTYFAIGHCDACAPTFEETEGFNSKVRGLVHVRRATSSRCMKVSGPLVLRYTSLSTYLPAYLPTYLPT